MSNYTLLSGRVGRAQKSAFIGALSLGLAFGTAAIVAPPATASFAPSVATADAPLQTCTPSQVRASQRFWAFGNSAGIDFAASGTTATAVKIPGTTQEGSTVVTDTTGAMLFWSNGSTLFNRDNQAMPNGTGLNINASATQTVAAFPSIQNPGTYFVVTNTGANEVGGSGQLYYSKVDLSLDGGKGDVTAVKNVPLGGSSDASESLTAIPNAEGDGFWVLTAQANTPNILAFEFDGDGPVSGTPVASAMSTNNGNQFGTLNVSEDLSQVVQLTGSTSGRSQVRVLNMNGATGTVEEKFSWDLPTGSGTGGSGYSADFSPAGDYVYATKIFGGARLFRYQVAGATSAADVVATEENLAGIGATGGQVRRGPDGRMYIANRTATALSVVNTPDATDPGFAGNGFPLAAGTSTSFGLPQTVTGCPRPPLVAEISGPSDGQEFEHGEGGTVSFGCSGAGLVSCTAVDENGDPVTDGQGISTTPGTHTITVTATDDKGKTVTTTVTYTVKPDPNVPPTATITGPAQNATYFQGQQVAASYSCADSDGTVASCVGPVANGADLDTAAAGTKTFTVTATDDLGATGTATATYKVVAVNGVCKGQGIGLPLGITLGTSNARETPCATEDDAELNVYVPITGSGPANLFASTVQATAIYSRTTSAPGLAAAEATVASAAVRIPSLALNLAVTAVKTDAKSVLSNCSSPAALSGSSKLGSLKLNGLPIVVGTQPLSVPLIVGGLYINQNSVSGNTVTRRAVFLDLPGSLLDVVIAESKAGATCGS